LELRGVLFYKLICTFYWVISYIQYLLLNDDGLRWTTLGHVSNDLSESSLV